MFGERWWNFLLIGVSKWEYDEKTIRKRERKCVPGKKSCKDEKWFKRNILHQLENKFHQTRSFNFAFIHSYSQIEDNKNDESEQKHWKEETDKLWSFVTSKNSSFKLKGVDDILQDNRRLKRQVDELENTIDTEIADLKGEIQMIKDTHDSELNQLKNKTLGEIQTIKETHNSELNQLKDDTLGEIQTIKDTHDSELNQLKDNTLVNKEELTQTIKTNKQELSNTMQNNKQELTTKIQNTIDTDISKIKGEVQMIKETHNSELNQLKDNTLGQINTNMGMLDNKMKQLKSDTKRNSGQIQENKKTLDTKMKQLKKDTKSKKDTWHSLVMDYPYFDYYINLRWNPIMHFMYYILNINTSMRRVIT